MSMTGHDIRQWVTWYVAGDVSLQEFQDWFVPRAWDISAAEDSEDAELAHEIELRLAEFSNGDWSEAELRGQLQSAVAKQAAKK